MLDSPEMLADPLDGLIELLPKLAAQHAPSGALHAYLKPLAISAVQARYHAEARVASLFPPFGEIVFPFVEMGNINSLDLFGLDELILFAFYWHNRDRYRRVADFGANLGLHSLVLDRCGFNVRAFEPDPAHLNHLRATLSRNGCENVLIHSAAVSTEDGSHNFTRVLGNTTGSHLTGAKDAPYGDLESFTVELANALPHMEWADLVKMDIEGHEADVLCVTDAALWRDTDAVAEVGTAENASRIYEHFQMLPVNLFAQKTGWGLVEKVGDMPTSHRDGSLFISTKDAMPWV